MLISPKTAMHAAAAGTGAKALSDAVGDAGVATILTAADNVVVAVGAEFDGQPALATLAGVDATLTQVLSAVWDGFGNLTITGNAAATANVAVSWHVMKGE